MVVGRDDDLVLVALDLLLPPDKGLVRDRASRVAAPVAASDRRPAVVAVAHHQKEDVADPKRVSLPGAF